MKAPSSFSSSSTPGKNNNDNQDEFLYSSSPHPPPHANDVQLSFSNWKRDFQALTSSMEFQQMIHSTGGLMSSTTQFLVHTACSPITVPMKKTASVVLGTANFVGGIFSNVTEKAFSSVETILFQNSASSNHDHNDHERMIQPPCNHFLKEISNVADILIHVMPDVNMDALAGLIHASKRILPWQGSQEGDSSADQSIRDGSALLIDNCDETSDHHDGNNYNQNSLDCTSRSITSRSKHDVSTSLDHQDADKISPAVGQLLDARITDRSNRYASEQGIGFRVRVCDLGIPPYENSSLWWKNQFYYLTCQESDEEHLCPPSSYSHTADTLVDKLVELALLLASDDDFQLDMDCVSSSSSPRNGKTVSKTHARMVSPIQWKQEGMTTKLLRKMQTKFMFNSWNKTLDMLEKEVLVWSGSTSMKDKSSSSCYGHGIPIFKARGIIADMNTTQLLELFMDSTKVKLYNKSIAMVERTLVKSLAEMVLFAKLWRIKPRCHFRIKSYL